MSTFYARLEREHRSKLVAQFADELSARLGRSAEHLCESGLRAGDFPLDGRVEITFDDGSFMALRYAFAVVKSAQHVLGVFTEHLGYFSVAAVCLHVRQLVGDVVVDDRQCNEKGKDGRGTPSTTTNVPASPTSTPHEDEVLPKLPRSRA